MSGVFVVRVKDVKFYIYGGIISLISLMLFVSNVSFDNISSLLTSCCVGMMPFLLDFFLFLDKTEYLRGDKVFQILRRVTVVCISLIMLLIFPWVLKSIGVLEPSVIDNTNCAYYLCFNRNNVFNNLNGIESVWEVVFSTNMALWYYVFIFVISVLLKFCNQFFITKNERDSGKS